MAPSYLPSIEELRVREPFDEETAATLVVLRSQTALDFIYFAF